MTNLKPANIQKYFSDKTNVDEPKARLSETTLHHHYAVLHAALRYAVKMQYLHYNPSDSVSGPRVAKTEMNVLDEDQLARLLAAAQGTSLHIPVLIAAYSGLRRGEVLGLKWQDIDLSKGQLTVRRSLERIDGITSFKMPKNNRARSMYISADLVRELKAHKERQAQAKAAMDNNYHDMDLVCATDDGGWLNPGSFSSKFRDFRGKLDLPAIRLHDLRHTNATLLLRQRVPVKVVSERLGHSTTKLTVDTYAHVLEGQDRQAAQALGMTMRKARLKVGEPRQ